MVSPSLAYGRSQLGGPTERAQTRYGWAAINPGSIGGGQYGLSPKRWPGINLHGLLELLAF